MSKDVTNNGFVCPLCSKTKNIEQRRKVAVGEGKYVIACNSCKADREGAENKQESYKRIVE